MAKNRSLRYSALVVAALPFALAESAADRGEGRSPPGSAQVECVGLSAT